MKQIDGGVTAAKGFKAASTAAGIKYKDRKDMAMIYSEVPCKAAGTFTTNLVKAAPVKWDKVVVENSTCAQAVIVNAGIANACRGRASLLHGNCPSGSREPFHPCQLRAGGVHWSDRETASDGPHCSRRESHGAGT